MAATPRSSAGITAGISKSRNGPFRFRVEMQPGLPCALIAMTAGQVSVYTRAAAPLGSLPKLEWLLADRGYGADWSRDALQD
jgi:hypothetical protein